MLTFNLSFPLEEMARDIYTILLNNDLDLCPLKTLTHVYPPPSN